MAKRGAAVLDTPEPGYAPESSETYPRRTSTKLGPGQRRDTVEDFAESYGDDGNDRPRSSNPRTQLKLKFARRIPKTLFGRIATGLALLLIIGTVVSLLMIARSFLLHDPRFMIQSTSAIEIQGNQHLTRPQLLAIFGGDVERNIFRISLDDRQAELEALPWVQRATIMRLLPGRIRVAIVERIPVAFVRQGGHIGLVDKQGVLLDMAAASQTEPHYSFPVVTGITASDPATTRTARMKIFERFTADLDSTGEKISENLSEVDLSNPEDVKALIPDHSTEVLVHFGDDHFLDRYRKYQELLPQWHTQFPNLASVDMRYEREVVLDMAKSANAKAEAAPQALLAKPSAPEHAAAPEHAKPALHAPVKPKAKAPAHPPAKTATAKPLPHPAAATPKPTAGVHPAAATPAPVSTTPSASAAARSGYPASHTLTAPAAVAKHPAAKPVAVHTPARTAPKPAAAKPATGKPAAGKPLLPTASYHPPQVPTQ
jgi:cell division protein FtsQ